MASELSGPVAVTTCLWYLNQLALWTRRYAVVHAGSVSGDVAVLLPGEPEAGKSTLVTALVQRGLRYLGDEFAPLRLGDGRLRPYRTAIGLDPGSFALFPTLRPAIHPDFEDASKWRLPCRGQRRRTGLMAPGVIVFPRYRCRAACALRPLDSMQALIRLSNETLNFREIGSPAFHTLSRLVKRVPAYDLEYGNLDEGCAAVVLLAGRGPR